MLFDGIEICESSEPQTMAPERIWTGKESPFWPLLCADISQKMQSKGISKSFESSSSSFSPILSFNVIALKRFSRLKRQSASEWPEAFGSLADFLNAVKISLSLSER